MVHIMPLKDIMKNRKWRGKNKKDKISNNIKEELDISINMRINLKNQRCFYKMNIK